MTKLEKQKNKNTTILRDRVARRGVLYSPAAQTRTSRVPKRQDPAKIKKKSENFMTVDVGNTYIHFAVCKGRDIVNRKAVVTVQKSATLSAEFNSILFALSRRYLGFNCVVICSVVPAVTKILEACICKNLEIKPLIVGRDIVVPIKNCYANPKQVGQDRLVCAYAASELHGYPVIVIDLGTAITLDVVSAKRQYLGGIIVPGIHITAETLFERTALLPLVEITKPKSLIGKDTQGSILSGIFYGYGEMLKGLIKLLSRDLKIKPNVILTGGHAKLMAKYIQKSVHVVEPDLVLKGLAFLAKSG